MQKMPAWRKYRCHWLGTQIQAGKLTKIRYALTAYLWALFRIWGYDIVHFHTVSDRICLLIQMPVIMGLYGAILGKALYTGDIDLKQAIGVAK